MGIIKAIYHFLHISFLKGKWRRRNRDNFTSIETVFPLEKVVVGKKSYGPLNVYCYHEDDPSLIIGSFCSIAKNVHFLLGGEHNYDSVSTYPFKTMLNYGKDKSNSKGSITIDDDVWIGYGVTILSGVHIGQGAIIGACSFVNSDVPPYAIVGGIPAKIIKFRFKEEIINDLLKINFEELEDDVIENHLDELYTKIERIPSLNWLPQKGFKREGK